VINGVEGLTRSKKIEQAKIEQAKKIEQAMILPKSELLFVQ